MDTLVRGGNAKESPDGKTLYFTRGWPGTISLWSMPVTGGRETKVLDDIGLDYMIGRKGIYFTRKSDKEGQREICHYEITSGEIRKMPIQELSVCWAFALSPDERTLLIAQREQMGSDLMLVENFQ